MQLAQLDAYVPPTTVEVLDRHGDPLDDFAIERRVWVPLTSMPPILLEALISAEDRRFHGHSGVDPRGVLRAAIANLRGGGISEGGSTLTQQLVKNLLVGDRRSYARKLEEALLARRLEHRKTKSEILELYLNYVYLGSGNYGVEAASRDYFGVGVDQLEVEQAAMLVAMIPAPSRYSPRLDPETARAQRKRVLFDLAEVGRLTTTEAERLSERPIEPHARAASAGEASVGSAYRTAVRRVIREHFHHGAAFRLGLEVDTPYDPAVQRVAEQAVVDAIEAVEERQGTTGVVEGAAVVLDNATGGVVAMTGGRQMSLEGFNHATQARRQPGSTFKPYVYGAALEAGHTQLDDVFDGPLTVGGWSPKNAGGYHGTLPMRSALTYSLNTVAVRLAMEVGIDEVVDFAQACGVRTPLRQDLTVALGSSEVTVLDQATGFATLARGGRHTEPTFLSRVRNWRGEELASAGDDLRVFDRDVRLPGSSDVQVVSESTAFQLVDMMKEVVESGTGRRAYRTDRDRAGKTGTTSDNVDAWFVGIIPTHTVAVWIGSTDNRSLGKGEYGGRAALPAWIQIVEALEAEPGSRFEVPPSVMLVPHRGQLVALPRDAQVEDELEELPPFPGGL